MVNAQTNRLRKAHLETRDVHPSKKERKEMRAAKEALKLSVVQADQIRQETEHLEETKLRRVSAYCTARSYDLKNLYKHLKEDPNVSRPDIYFGECLSSTYYEKANGGFLSGEVFYFEYGVVVCWGLDERQEGSILQKLMKYQVEKYDADLIESEMFKYGIVKEQSFVMSNNIYLNTEYNFNKLIISTVIAQSVKLDYFETIVSKTIDEEINELPAQLEKTGRVNMSKRNIMKLIGKLHSLTFQVNLAINILDTPEIVWHYPEFKELYDSFRYYMEIRVRVDTLNRRFDVIQGILNILSDYTSTKHAEKLEKIIILLIVIELVTTFISIMLEKKLPFSKE